MADNTKYAAFEIAKDIANAKLPDFDAALQQARRNRAAAEAPDVMPAEPVRRGCGHLASCYACYPLTDDVRANEEAAARGCIARTGGPT